MFDECKLPEGIRQFSSILKWPTVVLSVFTPAILFYAVTHYVWMYENRLVDETPPLIKPIIIACFILTLLFGLVTIPRWYSLVAFGSIILFIFVGMTSFP
jgi:hypothetical protein